MKDKQDDKRSNRPAASTPPRVPAENASAPSGSGTGGTGGAGASGATGAGSGATTAASAPSPSSAGESSGRKEPARAGAAAGPPRTPSSATPVRAGRPPGGGSPAAPTYTALIVALAALVLSGYQWYGADAERETVLARLQSLELRVDQAVAVAGSEQNARIESLRAVVDAQEGAREEMRVQIQALQGDMQTLRDRVSGDLGAAQLTQAELATLRGTLNEHQGRIESLAALEGELRQQVQTRITELALAQRSVDENLEAIRLIAARGGDIYALPLSEVEYLLRIADHKLAFQSDVDAAIRALSLAGERLSRIDEGDLAAVQIMIRENLAVLRGVQIPDHAALAQAILEMSSRVDTLPLRDPADLAGRRAAVRPDVVEGDGHADGGWRDMGERLLAQLRGVIVIHRERAAPPPLVAPEESYFLRENVRLQLQAMRLALLAGDAENFHASNRLAHTWLETYFNPADVQVAQTLVDLANLRSIEFHPYVPDIGGTVRAFADVIARRGDMVTLDLPPAPASAPAVEEAGDVEESGQ